MPSSRRQGRSWEAACRIQVSSPDGFLDRVKVLEGDRVDQPGAGALAAHLDQEGALAVAEAGGALGVHGDRAGAGGDGAARRAAGRVRWR